MTISSRVESSFEEWAHSLEVVISTAVTGKVISRDLAGVEFLLLGRSLSLGPRDQRLQTCAARRVIVRILLHPQVWDVGSSHRDMVLALFAGCRSSCPDPLVMSSTTCHVAEAVVGICRLANTGNAQPSGSRATARSNIMRSTTGSLPILS